MTMNRTNPILLLALILLVGCRGDDLGGRADDASLARFDALPDTAGVLLSLHGPDLPTQVPDTRPLGGVGDARLMLADRASLPGLIAYEGLDKVIVWGGEAVLGKMDALLRVEMLGRLHDSARAREPMPIIARFDAPDADLRDELAGLGAVIGSRSGDVVTLQAAPPVLLEILARPDLVMLEKPMLQQPSSNSKARLKP